MRIANPLYDHAFKFLMSNNRLAKKVISTILNTRVLKLELSQQEFVSEGQIRGIRVFDWILRPLYNKETESKGK